MAGLLDFLFQGGQGGGLLGNMGQPQNIMPPQQQAGMMAPQPGGIDPSFFANQLMQGQQPQGLFFNPNTGMAGSIRGALNQIADPEAEGRKQQQMLQNYLALKHLGLQETSMLEKPKVEWQEDESGRKVPYLVKPMGQGISRVPIQGEQPSNTGLPPNVNPKAVSEARGKAYVANEEDAVKGAKAAADIKPIIDEAAAAYEEAHKLGAIGPVAGSAVGRYTATGMAALGDATGLGSTSKATEAARQRYDRAQAALQARATQVQNAGQGAVSNYERELFAKPIPNLQALDPAEAMNVFKQMQAQTEQTVKAGRIPTLGQAPAVSAVLDRPSIPGGMQPPAPQVAPAPQPIKVTTQAQYNMIPPGQTYVAPDDSVRTKGGGGQQPQQPMGGLY